MKASIVNALIRLYRRSWRREYGPELIDILLSRPLTPAVIANVLSNGLRQRVLAAEPSTILGLALMPWATYQIAHEQRIVSLQTSNLYVLFLIACGLWTNLRYSGDWSRSGRAAVKLSCVAGLPAMQTGLLMLAGFLKIQPAQDYCWIRVSDSSTLLQEIQAAMCPPAALGVLFAPLFLLPASWLWGMLGGFLGRWISRGEERPSIVK
jgi:hypothetical protein